jgi:hypothetical protein
MTGREGTFGGAARYWNISRPPAPYPVLGRLVHEGRRSPPLRMRITGPSQITARHFLGSCKFRMIEGHIETLGTI